MDSSIETRPQVLMWTQPRAAFRRLLEAHTRDPFWIVIMAAWATVPGLFTGAIVMAVGQALAFPALMSVAINNAPARERGAVMGTFTAFFDLSFGGGALALGLVSRAFGYNGAFAVASGIATIGLFLVLFAPPPVRTPGEFTYVVEVEPPGE